MKENDRKGRKCSAENINLSAPGCNSVQILKTLRVPPVKTVGLPVGLRHMMTGVPDPWLSTLRAGLKAEEDAIEGWLAWKMEERKNGKRKEADAQ